MPLVSPLRNYPLFEPPQVLPELAYRLVPPVHVAFHVREGEVCGAVIWHKGPGPWDDVVEAG